MTIKAFIKKHRYEIDAIVKQYYGQVTTNDKQRYEAILSDEGLYRWAHREGVNI